MDYNEFDEISGALSSGHDDHEFGWSSRNLDEMKIITLKKY
jgi:hypothetical protein